MTAPPLLSDVTGTVSISDARSVGAEVERILVQTFGEARVDRDLLRAGFELVDRLFAGAHPGYLACDMPYHDLRHSIDTTLVMARLIAGGARAGRDAAGSPTPDHALVGILLALLHDVGYLREAGEAGLVGPQLMRDHEARGTRFAGAWLRTTSLAPYAPLATLIEATRLSADCTRVFAPHDARAVAIGRMLGTADLLVQIADRSYIERCYYHLYPELVLAGLDRRRLSDGRDELFYLDALDLVAKTRTFCEAVVRDRLVRDFASVDRGLADYFGGNDPYAEGIAANLDRLARLASGNGAELIGEEPATTTRELAAVYHAPRPGRDH